MFKLTQKMKNGKPDIVIEMEIYHYAVDDLITGNGALKVTIEYDSSTVILEPIKEQVKNAGGVN